MVKDTIAAISTPFGMGGIGIIRLSGEDSFNIIYKIFKPASPYKTEDIKTQTIKYGQIFNPQTKETLDEVLVSYFKKPYTYTRENIVEINCHGGLQLVKKILELVVINGARIAEPGEFTKRAFLNGRIDLSQAEAVIEVISSKTKAARKAALNQLEGKLSHKIKSLRDIFINILANIEAGIDYPEYDIEEISRKKIEEDVKFIHKELQALTETFFEGKIMREGIEAAIIGKPNVGKSSLLNALAQKEKAIITEIPGTTRDVIEEFIEIGGIGVKILDTAGLRKTGDYIERIGIEKSRFVIQKADLVLLILDGSEEINSDDKEIFDFVKDKKIIVVVNKRDIGLKIDLKEIQERFKNSRVIEISAKQETGLEKIEKAIKEMFVKKEIEADNEVIITNLRHKQIIEAAKKETENILEELKRKTPIDIISIAITEAASNLGQITGETVREEVIKAIFSKFCIGK